MLRRGLAATMVTGLVTLGAVALTAAPAAAHTNTVRGTAECVDGRYVVEWTVTNDDKDHDAALTFEVWPEKSDLTLADEIEAGGTITGTQVLPAGSTGIKENGVNVAKILVHGEWQDGDKKLTQDEFVAVPLPGTSCGTASESPSTAKPSADIELSCDVFAIKLVNPTARTVKFTVVFQFDDSEPVSDQFLVKAGKELVIPDDVEGKGEDSEDTAGEFDDSDEGDFDKFAVGVFHQETELASDDIDFSKCEDEASPSVSPEATESASAAPAAVTSVSPAAESSLPVTGASLGGLIAVATLVLGLGVTMVVFTRRRKRA